MKKKQKTFADRAKEIKNKYTRADWDKTEREDMMRELGALRNEQEQMRSAMGIPEEQGEGAAHEQGETPQQESSEEHAYGGNIHYDGTAPFQYLKTPADQLAYAEAYYSGAPSTVTTKNLNIPGIQDFSNLAKGPQKSYTSPNTSMAPSLISAGASVIGDVAGLINANKNMPKNITAPHMAPGNTSLQPQREGLQRDYNTNRNIMLRNSRDVSSPGNAYANQIAGLSSLSDSFGDHMGQSYMNEANANQQSALQVEERNQSADMNAQNINTQLQANRANVKAGYINSLSQTIPMALKDYREQANQDNMLNTLSKDYGMYEEYNPNMSFKEKLRRGILGPHYQILNKNNPNIR